MPALPYVIHLPSNEKTLEISSLLNELTDIIELAISVKKQTLTASHKLAGTTDTFWDQLSSIESVMLEDAKKMKESADQSLETSSNTVRRWQTFEIFLMVASLALAIVFGIYVSNLIVNPLKEAVTMLKDIAVGDEIRFQTAREEVLYTVSSIEIVDPSDISVLAPTVARSITLVTCYPFYFVGHAPKRYIVKATAEHLLAKT